MEEIKIAEKQFEDYADNKFELVGKHVIHKDGDEYKPIISQIISVAETSIETKVMWGNTFGMVTGFYHNGCSWYKKLYKLVIISGDEAIRLMGVLDAKKEERHKEQLKLKNSEGYKRDKIIEKLKDYIETKDLETLEAIDLLVDYGYDGD